MKPISISFSGDFAATRPNIIISDELTTLFAANDINVCNFEIPLEGNGEIIKKSGPILHQTIDSVKFLMRNRFNLFQVANNHLMDCGESGAKKTLNVLNNYVGAGNREEAYSLKKIEIRGVSLGFLSFSHHEFGVFDNLYDKQYGVAWINHPCVNKLIATSKKEVDFLFILPHAGIEEIDAPIPEWRERYKEFIDLGADAVIGTHPHVPQGWEEYNGKMIFYSLGNFFFDAVNSGNSYWNKGLMVRTTIADDNLQWDITNICFNSDTISIDDSQQIICHNLKICQLLKDEVKYNSYIDRIALILWEQYKIGFLISLSAFSWRIPLIDRLKLFYCMILRKPSRCYLINLLQCESHRAMVLRSQNILNQKK